jgi:hypothetical protein
VMACYRSTRCDILLIDANKYATKEHLNTSRCALDCTCFGSLRYPMIFWTSYFPHFKCAFGTALSAHYSLMTCYKCITEHYQVLHWRYLSLFIECKSTLFTNIEMTFPQTSLLQYRTLIKKIVLHVFRSETCNPCTLPFQFITNLFFF